MASSSAATLWGIIPFESQSGEGADAYPTDISAQSHAPAPGIEAGTVLVGYVGSGGSSSITGQWSNLSNAEGSTKGTYASWTAS